MNRFVLEDDDIIILGEKDATSGNLDNNSFNSGNNNIGSDEKAAKSLNGGPGSGNFGHAGRPGKVGGSAPTGSSSPEAITIIAGGVEKSMDFDTILKRRDLQQKLKKMKLEDFTGEVEEEMKKLQFSKQEIDQWRGTLIAKEITKVMKKQDRQKRQEKIKSSPEQRQAIENVISKVKMEKKDETWLRNNCDPEMAKAFSNEVDRANEAGIKNIRLKLNESKANNGRMGYIAIRDEYQLTIRKGILRDAEAVRQRRKEVGPNGSRMKTSEEINATFRHEFGHSLESEFAKKLIGDRGIAKSTTYFSNIRNSCSGAIIHQAIREMEKKGVGFDELRMNTGRKYMSGYGRTNNSEAIAESHANPKFSEFTQAVENVVTGKTPLDNDLLTPIKNRINAMEKQYQQYHS